MNKQEQFPAVLKLMDQLLAAGFQAYLVGGAVRDRLLGLEPKDYDVATDATPNETERLSQSQGWSVHDIGREFGRLCVIIGQVAVDVTTFRQDVYSGRGHRPQRVCFGASLRQDLARRDFTINALAMTRSGQILDFFGGQKDLKARCLRTVGDPLARFEEDALRLFRAVRFATRLNFIWDEQLTLAVEKSLSGVTTLSAERVFTEIRQILLSPGAGVGLSLLSQSGLLKQNCLRRTHGKEQVTPIWPEWYQLEERQQSSWLGVWQQAFTKMPGSPVWRYALLLLPVWGGHRDWFQRFMLPRVEAQAVQFIIQAWQWGHNAQAAWLESLLEAGYDRGLRTRLSDFLSWTGFLPKSLWSEQDRTILEMLLARPCETAELALSGRELAQLLPAAQIGQTQRKLLQQVNSGKISNMHEELLNKALISITS